MSGSTKGRKLRPYRSGPITPVRVCFRTAEQEAADEWEFGSSPRTKELLDWPIECEVADQKRSAE